MGWPPCPGLPCWSSWPLLGLGPSRLGPWIGVSSPKTGPMLAVLPMSFATASTETCGSEASSSVLLASSGVTSWSILVTHSVSTPTTLLSAGLPATPFHCRTWFLPAAWEPASERRCCSVLLSLMVRWSTPPCSGPACSDSRDPRGCGCGCGQSRSRWSQAHLCIWEAADPPASLRS
uniref:tRNA splicing endonuclease subunit 34 n=1 Tax=Ursus maritimus TaxID=29073 RepID=A0A452U2E1_URSMA